MLTHISTSGLHYSVVNVFPIPSLMKSGDLEFCSLQSDNKKPPRRVGALEEVFVSWVQCRFVLHVLLILASQQGHRDRLDVLRQSPHDLGAPRLDLVVVG